MIGSKHREDKGTTTNCTVCSKLCVDKGCATEPLQCTRSSKHREGKSSTTELHHVVQTFSGHRPRNRISPGAPNTAGAKTARENCAMCSNLCVEEGRVTKLHQLLQTPWGQRQHGRTAPCLPNSVWAKAAQQNCCSAPVAPKTVRAKAKRHICTMCSKVAVKAAQAGTQC